MVEGRGPGQGRQGRRSSAGSSEHGLDMGLEAANASRGVGPMFRVKSTDELPSQLSNL